METSQPPPTQAKRHTPSPLPQQHHHQPHLPSWHDSALPFMVVVRDIAAFGSQANATPAPSTAGARARQRRRSSISLRPESAPTADAPGEGTAVGAGPTSSSAASSKSSAGGGSAVTMGAASAPDSTGQGRPATTTVPKYKTIYPEIRYVFADDDFAPTIDVLDSSARAPATTPPAGSGAGATTPAAAAATAEPAEDASFTSLVVDFDATGSAATRAQSLSTGWQVTGVRSQSTAEPAWPAWAEAREGEACATVVYVDGMGVAAATAAPADGDNGSGIGSGEDDAMETTGVQQQSVGALIRRFRAVNGALRKILDQQQGAVGAVRQSDQDQAQDQARVNSI